MARNPSIFSLDWVSGIMINVRYPRALPTSANPMPVFPAVPSTMVPPGGNAPDASPSSTIPKAARSLTDPPGFRNSAFPQISHPVTSDNFRNRSNGVRPMVSQNPSVTNPKGAGLEESNLSIYQIEPKIRAGKSKSEPRMHPAYAKPTARQATNGRE